MSEPAPEEIKDFIIKLNQQHPNVWTKGAAYDAINPATGHPCKIRRSTGVRDRVPFLHIYVPVAIVLRSPTGEELSRRPGQAHYRANLHTYALERVD